MAPKDLHWTIEMDPMGALLTSWAYIRLHQPQPVPREEMLERLRTEMREMTVDERREVTKRAEVIGEWVSGVKEVTHELDRTLVGAR